MLFAVSFQFAQAETSATERVTLQPLGSNHMQAGSIEYAFRLVDNKSKKELSDTDLVISHTKKLHFITYDAALKEFRHVHPHFKDGSWNVLLDLPVDGNYFFWAQGMLMNKQEFSALAEGMIMGGSPENAIQDIGDVRSGIDGNTQITLATTKIQTGKMVMLDFKISRIDSKLPVITPYLGAFAHVIATPVNGTELTHVHPMAGKEPNTGILHAIFPSEGSYRLWIQFLDDDELKIIPLSVKVSK